MNRTSSRRGNAASGLLRAFHQWLRERYGTIGQLNEAWVRRYPDFDAIPPRAMGTYADCADWRRFTIERSNAELEWRIQRLRAEDPGRIMEVHAAHHPPMDGLAVSCVNLWGLAAKVDVWGLSIFPRWFSSAVFEGGTRIEITRSSARGKPFWLAELQVGHGKKGVWRSRAGSGVFWTYHTEGREAKRPASAWWIVPARPRSGWRKRPATAR